MHALARSLVSVSFPRLLRVCSSVCVEHSPGDNAHPQRVPSVLLPPSPHSLTGITVVNCHNSHSRSVGTSVVVIVVVVVVVCWTSCGLMFVCVWFCAVHIYFVPPPPPTPLPPTTTTAPSLIFSRYWLFCCPNSVHFSPPLAHRRPHSVASYPSSPRRKGRVSVVSVALRMLTSSEVIVEGHRGRSDSYPDGTPLHLLRHVHTL